MEQKTVSISDLQVSAMTLVQELGNTVKMLFDNIRVLAEQNQKLTEELDALKAKDKKDEKTAK